LLQQKLTKGKQMKKVLFTFISVMLFFNLTYSQQKMDETDSLKNDAIIAAKSWLKLVDEGKYEESWDNSAELFRNSVTKEQWKNTLNGFLPNFGNVVQRELISSEFKTTLPGAPDGKYVIILYKTEFKNKKNSIETIVPMIDKDGIFRISGYFIK
jgi:hypothetical protein